MAAEKPWFPVILAGIATTILTLMGLYFLTTSGGSSIMGWYAWYIVPMGAMLVGLLAASGYGLVSWFAGVKIKNWLLGVVLCIQIVAYGAAQYIEYQRFLQVNVVPFQKELAPLSPQERATVVEELQSEGLKAKLISGATPSLGDYIDENAREFTFESKYKTDTPKPFGVWGYAFLFLQFVGFVGGSLISPLALASHPFCERCQRYKQGKQLTLIPASVGSKLFQKTDPQAMEMAMHQGDTTLAKLLELGKEGRAIEFNEIIRSLSQSQKEAAGLPRRYALSVMRCRGCRDGELRVQLLEGQGRGQKITQLKERTTIVPPDFIQAVEAK